MRLTVLILVFSCALQVSAQPKVEHEVDPMYPLIPWQAQIQGDVTVELDLFRCEV